MKPFSFKFFLSSFVISIFAFSSLVFAGSGGEYVGYVTGKSVEATPVVETGEAVEINGAVDSAETEVTEKDTEEENDAMNKDLLETDEEEGEEEVEGEEMEDEKLENENIDTEENKSDDESIGLFKGLYEEIVEEKSPSKIGLFGILIAALVFAGVKFKKKK